MLCARFLDFLLPAGEAGRELLLPYDDQFLRIQGSKENACCCYCQCSFAEKSEPCCICSKGDIYIAQLLQREVESHRALEVRRQIIAASPDFKLLAAFQFVEDPSVAAITPLSLTETLAEEGFFLTPTQQQLIFRRLDRSWCCCLWMYCCCAIVPAMPSHLLVASDTATVVAAVDELLWENVNVC